jgi:hypothetical protein
MADESRATLDPQPALRFMVLAEAKGRAVDASRDRRLLGSIVLLQLAAAAPEPAPGCDRGAGQEIVVCGTRTGPSPYRLPKLPEKYGPKQIRAETDAIPGVHTRAHVDSSTMPDGNVSKRLMVTFTTPFGRKAH